MRGTLISAAPVGALALATVAGCASAPGFADAGAVRPSTEVMQSAKNARDAAGVIHYWSSTPPARTEGWRDFSSPVPRDRSRSKYADSSEGQILILGDYVYLHHDLLDTAGSWRLMIWGSEKPSPSDQLTTMATSPAEPMKAGPLHGLGGVQVQTWRSSGPRRLVISLDQDGFPRELGEPGLLRMEPSRAGTHFQPPLPGQVHETTDLRTRTATP